MVALRASSALVEPAAFVATARVVSYELRGEKCWFTLSIIPDNLDETTDECLSHIPYVVYRLFDDFKYFVSYLTLECEKYAERPPKLATRKRILSSKTTHAGRKIEDLNDFLSGVFALPVNIRGSICFSEFFGLWESDLSESLAMTPISVDLSKATIPTVSTVQEAFESFELESSPSPASPNSLQRSNTVASYAYSNTSESPLKVAPWNARHMTIKEKAVWQTKRSSLIRSHSCRSNGSGSVAVIAPFVRVKVILNSDNIINIMVARNIPYDDLRKRIFEKFCENQAFKPEDFESVVLAYKRENSLIVIATNEDLRTVLVEGIDKYTFYLPSSKLLDEFFWMREVAEINKSVNASEHANDNRDSGYISYRSLSNESLRERFLHENSHKTQPKQNSFSSLHRQNSTPLRRQNSLAAIRNVPQPGSYLRRQKTMAAIHQKAVITPLQHDNSETDPSTTASTLRREFISEKPTFYNSNMAQLEGSSPSIIFRLKVVLDSESCVVIPVRNDVTCSELKAVISKAFLQAGYSEERLESLQLIYRTMDSHFLTVENEQDVHSLISIVRLDERTPNISSLSLYLFPRGLFSSLRRGGVLLDIPLEMICVS
ncbi:hypothetical protein K7432_011125 [Basidiobolus ranarum]|uniref:PB1 domain-containing protein n=1 Tax=Basidiobolus ranarum TaxID=34480 RepID=A0ABR2VUE1_9FUNG